MSNIIAIAANLGITHIVIPIRNVAFKGGKSKWEDLVRPAMEERAKFLGINPDGMVTQDLAQAIHDKDSNVKYPIRVDLDTLGYWLEGLQPVLRQYWQGKIFPALAAQVQLLNAKASGGGDQIASAFQAAATPDNRFAMGLRPITGRNARHSRRQDLLS